MPRPHLTLLRELLSYKFGMRGWLYRPDRETGPIVTVLALAAAAILLGAWELAVTRLASVVYFFDLTYLALAVCLFGLGAGALWTRRYGARLRLTVVLVLLPTLMPICWWLISAPCIRS